MPNIVGLNYHDIPIGSIQPFGGTVAPTGWLICDGTAYSQTTYAALYSVLGGAFGTTGGNFNVPDLRGRFLRGSDNMGTGAAGRDPGDNRSAMNPGGNSGTAVGSVQSDALQGHVVGWTSGTPGTLVTNSTGYNSGATGSGFGSIRGVGNAFGPNPTWGTEYPSTLISDGTHGTPRTSAENRPISANSNYIIKFQ